MDVANENLVKRKFILQSFVRICANILPPIFRQHPGDRTCRADTSVFFWSPNNQNMETSQ